LPEGGILHLRGKDESPGVALMIGEAPAAAILSVKVALPAPLLLIAASANVDVPAEADVPEITPVAALIDKPEGRPVAA
jgi:hypothetical protein